MTIGEGKLILAIDAAIEGGSLAICHGQEFLAEWIGPAAVSKAEDLLPNIDRLMQENGLAKADIGLIAVSAGPGSFTGIRIGLATALGLKAGLGVPMSSESALKAIVLASGLSGEVTAALPVGRNSICIQRFALANGTIDELDTPRTISEQEFSTMALSGHLVAHPALAERSPDVASVACGQNIALAIAGACLDRPGEVTPALFIAKSF